MWTRKHVLYEQGKLPAADQSLRRNPPTIWRGTRTGGTSEGELNVDMVAKLPTHDVIRPSTLTG